MTLRLTVETEAWRRHVDATVARVNGLVPVVKGNGYGLGRHRLAALAATFADTIAVGTVHELDGLPSDVDVVVLTPTLSNVPPQRDVVLTVGSIEHVAAIAPRSDETRDASADRPVRVIVKIASSMQRYGGTPDLVDAARAAGLTVIGQSIHPPLAGSDDDRADEIVALLAHLDPSLEVWISHLSPDAMRRLPGSHRYRLRMGTGLWHGDKSFLHLDAEVLAVRPVRAGQRAGYRLVDVPGDGALVMVGAGSAHGVAALDDGRSPFHHRRRRLALLEPPHMHTSMVFVADGDECPAVGDRIDVQRPLITTNVDEVEFT